MARLPKGIRLKNGSYEARATIKKKSICIHGKDLDDVIARFEQAKALASMNIAKVYTVTDWFMEWLHEVKSIQIKSTSAKTTERLFKRTFGFYLGDDFLHELDSLTIQKIVNTMQRDNIAVSTIRRAISNFRECLDYAVACNLIDKNPSIAVVLPWTDKMTKEEIPLTREEQEILIQAAVEKNNWFSELLYVMLFTGLRVGEVGGLQWNDINFEKKEISVKRSLSCQYLDGVKTEVLVTPKTSNSYRNIPFLGDTETALLQQREKILDLRKKLGKRWRADAKFGDLVFVSSLGGTCSRYVVQKFLQRLVKDINNVRIMEALATDTEYHEFRKVHPHLLRHTFATRCFESGIEPKVVQAMMGHSNIATTLNIYTHVLSDKRSEELAKFEVIGSLPKINPHSHI